MFERLFYEMALFSLLGVLYYFYQKRKILAYEENKGPMIMGYVLQACLSVRGDVSDPALDPVIEALDDYLHNNTASPPTALLKIYADSPECRPELRDVILQGLEDLTDGKA